MFSSLVALVRIILNILIRIKNERDFCLFCVKYHNYLSLNNINMHYKTCIIKILVLLLDYIISRLLMLFWNRKKNEGSYKFLTLKRKFYVKRAY